MQIPADATEPARTRPVCSDHLLLFLGENRCPQLEPGGERELCGLLEWWKSSLPELLRVSFVILHHSPGGLEESVLIFVVVS